ncbi:family 43 glycosylhydrolase [Herbiconiux sp. 11R-BC]|uniref:family 43 glycosylhydrolase n=1 Tax=Herbiconiux sp. 11R-BC TaxID=3111637 RepID=UPI003C0816EF
MITHPSEPAVACNPLDITYRFQDLRPLGAERTVHREAADPSVVRYRDRYFLFASMSGGFWHSDDLRAWTYQRSTRLPPMDYAPDVREIDGALYVSASRTTDSPYFRSENPLEDDFTEVNPGFPFWDPHLFQDDDGATYFYWGCSNKEPLQGVQVNSHALELIGTPVALISGAPDDHGWEKIGENYVKAEPKTEREKFLADYLGDAPFIEGAWMTKHEGSYYFQYAAPGTEWNTYADGYYTGPSPLGPFDYSPHSPFSSKPGGFITAAGHGSTFSDAYGNWWHASTMRISVNHSFERRIGIFPAGFDDDGVLFCNQNFADYPHIIPEGPVDPWTETFRGWMLQSYRATATASSSVPGHEPHLTVDEDIRTWWVAGSSDPGEWVVLDLHGERTVHAIQINLADHDLARWAPELTDGQQFPGEYRGLYHGTRPTEFRIETSLDGERWDTALSTMDTAQETPHAFAALSVPKQAQFVRFTAGTMPFGAPAAVSGIRVFGHGGGDAPEQVRVQAERISPLTAELSWDAAATAQGYNVRYGIAPDKLYHSWLVYDQTRLSLPNLNAGVDYWVAVDPFNESGITEGSTVPIVVAETQERSAS